MPPFSPAANCFIANSMKLLWPSNPCQPWVAPTVGGSTRPVEPPAASSAGQSADAQYLAPGTRRFDGTGFVSIVLARPAAMVELPPPGVPAAGPPAAHTTCAPAVL